MVLKAGIACQLKDGEDCENTALAVERVASDLIALTNSVATALNRALKKGTTAATGKTTEDDDGKKHGGGTDDAALLQKWCEFYRDELLPQTRSMVKKTSSKLDAYGLFLPSRMGTTVSPDVLQKGLNAVTTKTDEDNTNNNDDEGAPVDDDDDEEEAEGVVVEDKEAKEEPDTFKEEEEEEEQVVQEEEDEEAEEKEEKGEAVEDFAEDEGTNYVANLLYKYNRCSLVPLTFIIPQMMIKKQKTITNITTTKKSRLDT